ncbi:MAG: hypothetical protein JW807_10660 [Spirochaetes bacterium]|nr:hypothetical protein [Spirochaetota bacterium]
MALFDENVKQQISGILKNMKGPVNLDYFTQEFECAACRETHSFVEEFAKLSDRIKLSIDDFQKDRAAADGLHIDKIPAIAIKDGEGNDTGIRFYGLPGGYEINSFIGSVLEVSGHREPLKEPAASRVAAVSRDVHIQVFVMAT